jgi:spoIIIJ-associated protein
MDQKELKPIVVSLLKSMGFSDIKVKSSLEGDYLKISVASPLEQSNTLIGRNGEGIDALQLIVNLILNNQSQDWQRVLVNVNDYRESREEIIKQMASKAAQNVKTTGKEVVLNYLPSHERRIAHMHLDQDEEIQTYSQGEGKYRRMVIGLAHQE